MTAGPSDTWDQFWNEVDRFKKAIAKSTAVNVNTNSLRSSAKGIVQYYFRETRRGLLALGLDPKEAEVLDAKVQELLILSNGRNPKNSYMRTLRQLSDLRPSLETKKEMTIGSHSQMGGSLSFFKRSLIEDAILQTLNRLLPTAAHSYEQSIQDLQDVNRKSFRGTAVELRETIREVLDHLAPDSEVMQVQGFQLDEGKSGPTMKQKVRFILRSRKLPANAIRAPEDSVALVENSFASLFRSAYERGSIDTHVTPPWRETHQLKLYVDSVLCELLQIDLRLTTK